jgi:tetratricopeptide (TPR) repeat protein
LAHQLAGLRIVAELGDRYSRGVALNRLGRIHEALDHTDAAYDVFQEAADHFTAADQPQAAALAQSNAETIAANAIRQRLIAASHAATGKADDNRFDEAVDELTTILTEARMSGDNASTSHSLGNLAYVYMKMGHYARADACVREALSFDEPGSPFHIHHLLTLANIRQIADDEPSAAALYETVLADYPPDSGHDRARGIAFANLAQMSGLTADQQRNLYVAALAAFRAAGAPEADDLAQRLAQEWRSVASIKKLLECALAER